MSLKLSCSVFPCPSAFTDAHSRQWGDLAGPCTQHLQITRSCASDGQADAFWYSDVAHSTESSLPVYTYQHCGSTLDSSNV